jgi:hypothetical protein
VHLVNSQVRPIAEVKAGDIVLSFDDSKQRTVPARVRRRVSQTVFEIIVLHLANRETIETTPRQKLMTMQRGLVRASSLVAGHNLRTHDDKSVQVMGVSRRIETTLVHYLELESGTAYHVGDVGARTTVVKNDELHQSPGAQVMPSRPARPRIGPKPT